LTSHIASQLRGAGSITKVSSHSAGQEIPWSYRTWRFISVFAKDCHWAISWTHSVQAILFLQNPF